MSIQSEITRLSDARAALDAAIAAKGVQVPGSARLGDLPALIAAIAGQKPEQSKTVSPALAQQMVTPDAGKTLSGVTVEAVTKELLAALDESFKAENIKNGASILGLPGTFSPFGANAGISNYLIETFDFTDVGTSGGNAIVIRREGLGWIPHAAIHVLVGDSETGSPIAPNNMLYSRALWICAIGVPHIQKCCFIISACITMAPITPGGCRLLICSIQPIPSIRIDGRKTTAAWRDSNQSAIT